MLFFHEWFFSVLHELESKKISITHKTPCSFYKCSHWSTLLLHQLWGMIQRGILRVPNLPSDQGETIDSGMECGEKFRGRNNIEMDNGQTIYNNRTDHKVRPEWSGPDQQLGLSYFLTLTPNSGQTRESPLCSWHQLYKRFPPQSAHLHHPQPNSFQSGSLQSLPSGHYRAFFIFCPPLNLCQMQVMGQTSVQ